MTKSLGQSILTFVFFLTILTIPVASLFWSRSNEFIHINRVVFIFYPVITVVYLIYFRETTKHLFIYFLVIAFYCLIFHINQGEYDSLVRFFVPIFPFLTLYSLKNLDTKIDAFLTIYLITLLLPLSISILQLCQLYPFYDTGESFWLVDEGRISGGYLKPNNLVAYFFPAYLYAFYLLDKKETKKGIALILICLLVVFTTYLRTGMLIYCLLLLSYFYSSHLDRLIHFYYRNYGPLVVGIATFFLLGIAFHKFGILHGLRDRLPMWQAHSAYFFNGEVGTILFGLSQIKLPDYFHQFLAVLSYTEAHNNTYRIIITFGIVGFTIYCLWMRQIYLSLREESQSPLHRFLTNSCFVYFIVYSTTNEPSFYASIFLTIFAWVFLVKQQTMKGQTFRG